MNLIPAALVALVALVIIILAATIKIVGPFDLSGAFYSSKPMHIILYYYYEHDSVFPKFVPVNITTNNILMTEVVGGTIKNNKVSHVSVVYI